LEINGSVASFRSVVVIVLMLVFMSIKDSAKRSHGFYTYRNGSERNALCDINVRSLGFSLQKWHGIARIAESIKCETCIDRNRGDKVLLIEVLPLPRNQLSWEGRRKVVALRPRGSTRAQRMTAKENTQLRIVKANENSGWK
jgi:hypothetical protein